MLRGRSEAGLSRWPVTPEIAGSSPVAPEEAHRICGELLFFIELIIHKRAVAQG